MADHFLSSGQKLVNVHPPTRCVGQYCTIHNPSEHHMREWTQFWRQDAGFMERTCPHGVGHPDPDEPYTPPGHGCDGCCRPPEPTPVEEVIDELRDIEKRTR